VARVLLSSAFEGGAMLVCEREVAGARGSRFTHRRCVVEALGAWLVVDGVHGDGVEARHEAEALWHTPVSPAAILCDGDQRVALEVSGQPEAVVLEVFSSGGHEVTVLDDPGDMRTWYSRWYGDLQRGATVRTAMPVGDGCRMVHVIRRRDVAVRFDGWRRGGPVLSLAGDSGTRVVEVALEAPALAIDGVAVTPPLT
jgi:hypothetical protein